MRADSAESLGRRGAESQHGVIRRQSRIDQRVGDAQHDAAVPAHQRARYPNLLRAFECIRRALLMPERDKDVLRSEIPETHPAPGHHDPPQTPAQGGGA